jgi:hypothetical protein
MQAPPGKTVDDEIFFAVYSTYFGGIQFMQNNTDKRLNRFFGDQQATGNFIYRITI